MEGLSTNSKRISQDQYGNSKRLTKEYGDKNVYYIPSNMY